MSRAPKPDPLSRRERQVMDVLFRLGEATADEVLTELPDPPTNSAIRFTLRTLIEKGRITHRRDGRRFVYKPTGSPRRARRSALRRVVDTFFAGSTSRAVASLLEESKGLSGEELDELERLVSRARKEGR
ncbi:MAG: BlaI/MecI/CopY family transcriptional regulator [bacterium]|nr:BlaI/MecI/CopY family transcriptional regulator [bacterium]